MNLKRNLGLFLLTFIVFSTNIFTCNNVSAQNSVISEGDYIEFGTYEGEPILWRFVSKDENGLLMVSDKILCLKSYDAAGDSIYHYVEGNYSDIRKEFGSNCWEDSNLRQWLNSEEKHVVWSHSVPEENNLFNGINPYSNEEGFLSNNNFSNEEKKYINEVTHKIYINDAEMIRGLCDGGIQEHPFDDGQIEQLNVINYDMFKYRNVKDRVFLLGPEQLLVVKEKFPEYVYSKPTSHAIKKSNYSSDILSENSNYYYWICLPGINGFSYEHVICVTPDGKIMVAPNGAYNGTIGVRPAFYLSDVKQFNSGEGNLNNPYKDKELKQYDKEEYNISQDEYFIKKGFLDNVFNTFRYTGKVLPDKEVHFVIDGKLLLDKDLKLSNHSSITVQNLEVNNSVYLDKGTQIISKEDIKIKSSGSIDLSNASSLKAEKNFIFMSTENHEDKISEGSIYVTGGIKLNKNFKSSGKNKLYLNNMVELDIDNNAIINKLIINNTDLSTFKSNKSFNINNDIIIDYNSLPSYNNNLYNITLNKKDNLNVKAAVQATILQLDYYGKELFDDNFKFKGTFTINNNNINTVFYSKWKGKFYKYEIQMIDIGAKIIDKSNYAGAFKVKVNGETYNGSFGPSKKLMDSFKNAGLSYISYNGEKKIREQFNEILKDQFELKEIISIFTNSKIIDELNGKIKKNQIHIKNDIFVNWLKETIK